jgi:hypothetical protein
MSNEDKFKLTATILTIITITCLFAWILKQTPIVTDDQAQATEGHTFEKMLDAIWFVETECGLNSEPGQNGEIGDYQLKKIYIDECNRILELNGETDRVAYDDRYDPAESRKITAYVTGHYANNDWYDKPHTRMQFFETAARSHHRPADRNNSKTDAYWAKVKARMESQK